MDASLCNLPLVPNMDASNVYKETERVCVAHERIRVRVTVTNPLQLPLTVTNMHLRCTHRNADGNADDETGYDGIEIERLDVELNGNESTTVELGVVCRRTGTLQIQGVVWEVCDIVKGFKQLELPPRTELKQQGNHLATVLKLNHDLCVPVRAPLPLLAASLKGWPAVMLHGEVRT